MSLESLVGWLTSLPPTTLLWAMALLALAENVFPPIPADVLIALGAFLAARVGESPLPAFLAVLSGNVVGAMTMYAVGRRFGADWTERKFRLRHKAQADAALSSWYARYGLASLFLGRFIPGVRAIVPPFAGALRAPVAATTAAILLASGLWYGVVTIIAYRAGTNWEQLVRAVGRLGTTSALVAGALAAAVASVWWLHRRRRRG
ncbi:MAG TPA: DedA family protein [Gemmatimonadaceae bacterium]